MMERLRADEALHEVAVLRIGSGMMGGHDARRVLQQWERLAEGPAKMVPKKMTAAQFEAANAALGFAIEKHQVG